MSVKRTLAALDREIARAGSDRRACQACGGSGRGIRERCGLCRGTGYVVWESIPAATNPSARIGNPFKGYTVESYSGDGDVRFSSVYPSEREALREAKAMVDAPHRDMGIRLRGSRGKVLGNWPVSARWEDGVKAAWADLDRAEVARTAKYREESAQWSRKIPDRGFCIAISRSQGYEGCFLTKAAAVRAGQLLADAKRETVTLVQVQGHGNDRFMAGEIDPTGRR